jgi:hypothetical protein
MTAEMVTDWLREPEMCAELSACPHVDPQEMLRRAPAALAELEPLADRVLGRFAGLCQARAG